MQFLPATWFVVTWSLAVEEQFYLIIPPLLRFLSLRKVTWILATTICAAPFLRFAIYRLAQNPLAAAFPMPCRADALAWGVLLAIAWRKPAFHDCLGRHPRLLQFLLFTSFLGVAALLWWLVRPINLVTVTIGYTWISLSYACLLLLAISQTNGWIASLLRWPKLQWLGTVSYCVYIIHLAFNYLAHYLLLHAFPEIYNARGLAVTLLALVLTLSVAALSWRYFERYLIRLGHSYSYDEATAAHGRHILKDTAPAQS
jgi:peptidoglycan/LPS O-acetylase OafA/YrhL